MAKVTPITEHFQHFVKDLKESFWGDLQGRAQHAAKQLFELLSERQRDLYMVSPRYSRGEARRGYRNGYYGNFAFRSASITDGVNQGEQFMQEWPSCKYGPSHRNEEKTAAAISTKQAYAYNSCRGASLFRIGRDASPFNMSHGC